MSINGLAYREVTLPPGAMRTSELLLAERQVAVFGAGRLAMAEDDAATPEAAAEFAWRIEQLCSGEGSASYSGIDTRLLPKTAAGPLSLQWNPAGTVGGFGSSVLWDGAVASMSPTHRERFWAVLDSARILLPYRASEGIFVDRDSGLAMVQRAVHPIVGGQNHGAHIAYKPATTQELVAATAVLLPYVEQARQNQDIANLPRYLEVGYGLDPAAIRGRRDFSTKISVGVDRAVGNYSNPVGPYADAVVARSKQYAEYVAAKKAEEHILFMLGDAGNLPFLAGTIREVYMSNVLNADLKDGPREQLLKEAARVIGAAGSLVVRVNWHQDAWPHDKMVSYLRSSGFFVSRTVDKNEAAYLSLEEQYGTPKEVPAPAGYYVVAQPR
jgi:hypothetical protein